MNTIPDARPSESVPSRWQRLLVGKHPTRTLIRACALVGACFVVFRFILLPIRVSGTSMIPTYRSGTFNLVNRLSYRSAMPRRGDVVSIYVATNLLYLKRVIALPGETIAMYHGKVSINGKTLDEPYVKLPGSQTIWPYPLGEDEYFLAGDNRAVSQVGTTGRTNIVGKVLF